MSVYIYKDPQLWYEKLYSSLEELDVHSTIFLREEEISDNDEHPVVFIHMTHYSLDLRRQNKELVEKLVTRENLTLIPSIEECRLFDNKIFQFKTFEVWMPETWYVSSFGEGIKIANSIDFPIISKSSKGAGSSNVRFLKNRKEAIKEVQDVFKGDGIVCWLKDRQKDYLLWQEFLPDNPNDWRVILFAKKYAMLLKRNNRPDVPFASGSGNIEPIEKIDNSKWVVALDYTKKFADTFDFRFLAVDVLFDKSKRPVILETSTGWTFAPYAPCRIFEFVQDGWLPTSYTGADMFDLIAKLIADGAFE